MRTIGVRLAYGSYKSCYTIVEQPKMVALIADQSRRDLDEDPIDLLKKEMDDLKRLAEREVPVLKVLLRKFKNPDGSQVTGLLAKRYDLACRLYHMHDDLTVEHGEAVIRIGNKLQNSGLIVNDPQFLFSKDETVLADPNYLTEFRGSVRADTLSAHEVSNYGKAIVERVIHRAKAA